MKRLFLVTVTVLWCAMSGMAQYGNGPVGFVNYNDMGRFGVTGGGNGEIVHVSSRADFERYVAGSTPYVIILDADLTGGGMQNLLDEISCGSNKTIIGSGSGKALNGICLDFNGQSNIIIRNITLTKGRTDGISMRTCHHVWIDHCDLSNSYDGLLDFTVASSYMTCSWTKLHDHDKVSITNSGTWHFEDYGKERVTFAHCWFDNNVQRNPRIGYGLMHIYNCYWTNISSYCIGFHSQAQVLSEYNYFTSTARKAFNNQYTAVLPYCGYLTDNGSYLEGNNPKIKSDQTYTGINYTPKTYYDFLFDQTAVEDVPAAIQAGVGPKDGLAYEPILNPGNGAIEVPCDYRLSWGAIENVSSAKVYIGTDKDNLQETTVEQVSLVAGTTYYWKVVVTVNGAEHSSPIYQFTTAKQVATNPYPAHQSDNCWYRWPAQQNSYCTPMSLTWRTAFDAKKYKVYLSTDEKVLDDHLVGETTGTALNPGSLKVGETYYWRVDAETSGGQTVKGDVWTFSTPKKYWKEGKNEVEDMYLSGIAFQEFNIGDFSAGRGTMGDQGPGAICGLWNGAAGTYAIETTYRQESTGSSAMALILNNQFVDEWKTQTNKTSIVTRKTRRTVHLEPGDEIRLDFVQGGEARCRIDYVRFTASDQEIIDVERASAQPHSPVSTVGWDCEYLQLSNILFKDTLGVVGDKGTYQITDNYCPWISYSNQQKVFAYTGTGYLNPKDDKYATMEIDYSPAVTTLYSMDIYLRDVALAKFYYTGKSNESGALKVTYQEIGGSESGEVRGTGATQSSSDVVSVSLDKTKKYKVTLIATKGVQLIYAATLYKVVPEPFEYYEPTASQSNDYQLIWSPDMIFKDASGVKGNAGLYQIRDGYDRWCDYFNPTSNSVMAKDATNTALYKLDPVTDQTFSSMRYVTGTANSHACYIVGTRNSMTYYLQNTKKIKYYYTGSGGAAKALHLVIKENGVGEGVTVQGPEAIGKSVNSNAVETELDPTKKYTVTIIADSDGGDMLVYATKLWPGELSGVRELQILPEHSNSPLYNIQGQRVDDNYRGIVISKGRKYLKK